MISNHLLFPLTFRVALLLLSCFGLAYSAALLQYPITSLIIFLVLAMQVIELYRWLASFHQQIGQYIAAINAGDSIQELNLSMQGAYFEELQQSITQLNKNLQQSRQQQQVQQNYLSLLIEHIPSPVISIKNDSSIKLHNNAAQHLFSSFNIVQLGDLKQCGESFYQSIHSFAPQQQGIVRFEKNGSSRQLMAVTSEISIGNEKELIICLQDIQHELDDVQLQSWQKLVRVLTHEMMNSLTPITSLNQTIHMLAQDCQACSSNINNHELNSSLEDISQASSTVAKRSKGLTDFIENYRSITTLPVATVEKFAISDLFADVTQLFKQAFEEHGIKLIINTSASHQILDADRALISQVLINLVTNAQQALMSDNINNATITIAAQLNLQGLIEITVEDNGKGIAKDAENEIFMPFYTTKPTGNGIGLALVRQIMLAHQGRISFAHSLELGGAKFSLIF